MASWGVLFFLIGLAGTWLARRYAVARSLLDEPGERRSHQVATPRGGGAAIVVAMLIAWGMLLAGWGSPLEAGEGALLSVFASGLLLVAAVGWIDDHRPLSPALRLLVHILASTMFAAALHVMGAGGWLVVIGFIAPLVLTNIWNFMDGINGLAASQALLLAAVLMLWLDGAWSFVALALMAAVAGFFPFNFPNARIFMGDVGSGAIGYAIGALCAVLMLQRPLAPDRPDATLILLPLAPFLVDAGLTLFRRVLRGERWWTAHVQHAYQACARRLGHAPVTLGYACVTVAGAVLAWCALGRSPSFIASSILAWYMSAAILWVWLQRNMRETQGAPGNGADPSNKENG
ncbi:MraY family glycosyltransferase [Marilutibacter alkalisoli]|uniref:Lipopolysaccharide biosynthesis protein n=1 Tax=Marilutibacter alkalisoli TaxID=2591633 RepID=A0A514BRV4_9GAMM|nr:lipopolysaccharide biosynthesis protein [Lysobacter alkalisoli]QDH70090.1 lipopolysaccharide biosynthesis protein [Lysobacter alkalisoli]